MGETIQVPLKIGIQQEAQQAAVLFEAFAHALIQAPTEDSANSMESLIACCGEPVEHCPVEQWKRSYASRFVLASSQSYIPLREGILRGIDITDAHWERGTGSNRYAVHAVNCYRKAKFAYENVGKASPLAGCLHPDHLAVELAFAGYLNHRIAYAPTEEDYRQWMMFAVSFTEDHLLFTTERTALIAATTPSDVYKHLLLACNRWTGAWLQQFKESS